MSPPNREPIEINEASIGEPSLSVAAVDPIDTLPRISERDGTIKNGKLAGMTMWRAVWVLAWPVLIEAFLNSLVGVTDTTLAAGLSEPAADAVGGAAYFMWVVGIGSIALGMGGTAMVARAMGKGRLALSGVVAGQCATLSIASGLVTGLFIIAIAPVIATWLSLGPQAHAEAVTYMRLCALAAPMQTFAQVGIACIRGAGDSVRPLVLMVVINLLNLVLSFFLSGVDLAHGVKTPSGEITRQIILANPSPINLGVSGIALGTCIAWTFGAIIMLVMLTGGVHGMKLRAQRLRPHWHTMRRLVRIGLPNMAEVIGMWLGNFILILMVGWMNTEGFMGAHVLAVRIEAFSFLAGFALSLAAATLAGQYLGAGSPAMAKQAVIRCTLIAMTIMGLFGLAFMLIPTHIAGLFTQQPAHLELVPKILPIFGSIEAIFAVSIVLRSALRGVGDTTTVMWITWITIWGFRMPLAWLGSGVPMPLPWGGEIPNPAPLQALGVHPLVGFEVGLCVELLIRSALFSYVFFKGNWTKKKV
ncbi:MAG: MATE family efflux transporter [Phycisphaerae bacterium]|nr:MATE family efflux transporter [Phycisphaerae bacterium]